MAILSCREWGQKPLRRFFPVLDIRVGIKQKNGTTHGRIAATCSGSGLVAFMFE